MSADWDWEAQRADTEWTVAHLIAEEGVVEGTEINLDIQTIAAPESGPLARAAYLSALSENDLKTEIYENDDGVETIEVSRPSIPFSVEAIWTEEQRISEIALACRWQPDGWGFWEPDA